APQHMMEGFAVRINGLTRTEAVVTAADAMTMLRRDHMVRGSGEAHESANAVKVPLQLRSNAAGVARSMGRFIEVGQETILLATHSCSSRATRPSAPPTFSRSHLASSARCTCHGSSRNGTSR